MKQSPRKNLRKKRLLLLFVSGIVLFELLFLLQTGILRTKTNHTVTLGKKGFSPEVLSIKKGDTVTFKTTLGMEFWPASNVHPTHEIFSEFDPKRAIPPNESWTFRFDKPGSWRYHDHINASYTGIIVVTDSKQQAGKDDGSSTIASGCAGIDQGQKQQCWDNVLNDTLKTKGLDTAFAVFTKLYETEPDIPKACHGWGHILGQAAYELYAQKQDIVLRPETSYCGYGFFHGFMEKMLATTGSIKGTSDFCTYAAKQLEGKLDTDLVYRNCVHGIGHGYTAWTIENPAMWGKFQAVADKGLANCEDMFGASNVVKECQDGVFNELQQDLYHSEYGLSYEEFRKKNDPFFYCRNQKENYKESCYFEFVGLFNDIFKNDLATATKFILTDIPNPDHQHKAIAKLAADFMQDDIVKNEYSTNVNACRLVPPTLFTDCFDGIINGFLQHGEPGKELEKAVPFCKAPYLTAEEKSICSDYLCRKANADYKKNNCKT